MILTFVDVDKAFYKICAGEADAAERVKLYHLARGLRCFICRYTEEFGFRATQNFQDILTADFCVFAQNSITCAFLQDSPYFSCRFDYGMV